MKTYRCRKDLAPTGGIAEVRLQVLRETPPPFGGEWPLTDTPERVVGIMEAIAKHGIDQGFWRWDLETSFCLFLNVRRRVIAFEKLSEGTVDTLLVHPREVFRVAIVVQASALVFGHTHPSGDPMPSEGDIRVTRDLFRAGQLLKIDVLDSIIIGAPEFRRPEVRHWTSLRELGYFYS